MFAKKNRAENIGADTLNFIKRWCPRPPKKRICKRSIPQMRRMLYSRPCIKENPPSILLDRYLTGCFIIPDSN